MAGIAPDDIGRWRGVRGDERVQGHGIGLSIVQDLIKDYRGELAVGRSSELGAAGNCRQGRKPANGSAGRWPAHLMIFGGIARGADRGRHYRVSIVGGSP